LIGISVVLFMMNWKLTLLVFIPAPLVVLMSRLFWRRMFRTWNRYWHFRQRLSAFLNDSLSGIRVVRAFAQERQEVGRFSARSEDLYLAGMSAEQMWSTYWPMLSFIISSGTLIVWYVGGRQVVGSEMSIGTLTTFIAYLGMFYGPMQFL